MPRKRDRERARQRDELSDELSKVIASSVRSTLHRTLSGAPDLPDGVVTIVFTDVEGSSEIVRDLGDAKAHTVLRRHDELVRQALAAHDGLEVERAGDAFMLAFRLPTKAVSFALDVHARLAEAGEVRVRIGMDTGEVIREERGYFGRTVFRAARIAELGGGGQVLASHATKLLAEVASEARFLDLGERELGGLGDTVRLFEVLPAEVTSTEAPSEEQVR